jgi:hypothetical protein
VKWGRHEMRLERPAPVLGQHSREVLLEFGVDSARVSELIAKGIVLTTDLPETPLWRLLSGETA